MGTALVLHQIVACIHRFLLQGNQLHLKCYSLLSIMAEHGNLRSFPELSDFKCAPPVLVP